MLLATTATMSTLTASDYLKRVSLEEYPFSQQRVKTILAAAILRYLAGRTTIQFVFDLNAVLGTYKEVSLDTSMLDVSTCLSHLAHQVAFAHSDEEKTKETLHIVLEKLTH